MPARAQVQPFTSRFLSAADGLRLHLRDYGPRFAPALPVICLPGLARTAADFDWLARALASGAAAKQRRVLALDYRGRGESEWDRDPSNYSMGVENADILTMLAALEISEAIVIGTSRGGLHVMMLAATRPTLLRGVVLNDIGPKIESEGLLRIRGYVGKLPQPRSIADAVDMFKEMAGQQFPALSDADWKIFAELTFADKNGQLVPRYDKKLAHSLKGFDIEQPLPTLWPQFAGLADIPILAIRGELSDILSEETLSEMQARHPSCQIYRVKGQGHAPLLIDDASIQKIAEFIAQIDAGR
jgi:pimeloyl-ACP methyl ester carboxylesterase